MIMLIIYYHLQILSIGRLIKWNYIGYILGFMGGGGLNFDLCNHRMGDNSVDRSYLVHQTMNGESNSTIENQIL